MGEIGQFPHIIGRVKKYVGNTNLGPIFRFIYNGFYFGSKYSSVIKKKGYRTVVLEKIQATNR